MIEEEFDPWLFLDPNSYPAAFKANKDKYYPEKGENVLLFFSGNITQHNLQAEFSMSKLVFWFWFWEWTPSIGRKVGIPGGILPHVRTGLTNWKSR